MAGKILTPLEWYNRKLNDYPSLKNNQTELVVLKDFVDFLQNNDLYMSVVGEGRDTKKSSIYTNNSTDKAYWLCDIKFFDGTAYANDVDVVGKEKMNIVNDIYENQEFSKVLEVLTGKSMQLGTYSTIKEQITISGFKNALSTVKKAIKIYKVFR
ncbi:MAG: hypothetical protein RSA29_14485 [Clostridium sp.]|uniref:hypothetical protein n=1 Tax=Clostridium sp. TaxID=1506 RepID=UPI003216A0DC